MKSLRWNLAVTAFLATTLMPENSGAAVQADGVAPPAFDTVTQLIVRFKEDPGEAQLRGRMDVVRRIGEARGVTLMHGRRGALGMHVLRLDRRIAIVEAVQLADALAMSDPNGGATAWFTLGSNGSIWASTPYSGSMSYGNWLSPQTGMSNYQARAINSGCVGPTSWVSLGTDQTWSVSTGGWYEGEQANCSFTLQIRRASDGVILTSAAIDMTAYTGWW